MRRVAAVLVLVVALLSALLLYRLRSQAALARGPSGGAGEIEGTDVSLSARLTARVEALQVRKGAEVRRGDLLLTLDCSDARAALAEAEARVASSRAQAAASAASVEASRSQREAAAAAQLAAQAQAQAVAAQRDAAARQAGSAPRTAAPRR